MRPKNIRILREGVRGKRRSGAEADQAAQVRHDAKIQQRIEASTRLEQQNADTLARLQAKHAGVDLRSPNASKETYVPRPASEIAKTLVEKTRGAKISRQGVKIPRRVRIGLPQTRDRSNVGPTTIVNGIERFGSAAELAASRGVVRSRGAQVYYGKEAHGPNYRPRGQDFGNTRRYTERLAAINRRRLARGKSALGHPGDKPGHPFRGNQYS